MFTGPCVIYLQDAYKPAQRFSFTSLLTKTSASCCLTKESAILALGEYLTFGCRRGGRSTKMSSLPLPLSCHVRTQSKPSCLSFISQERNPHTWAASSASEKDAGPILLPSPHPPLKTWAEALPEWRFPGGMLQQGGWQRRTMPPCRHQRKGCLRGCTLAHTGGGLSVAVEGASAAMS